MNDIAVPKQLVQYRFAWYSIVQGYSDSICISDSATWEGLLSIMWQICMIVVRKNHGRSKVYCDGA
jgi:hypothetical protein